MAKFTMLIGIQASGKSSYAHLMNKGNTRVLSSDSIREALLGDRKDQDHNQLVFNVMNRQVLVLLESGYDVIYDATNASLKRRTALLKTLPKDVETEAIFFPISLKTAIRRDAARFGSVGEEVITRTYKSLDVPMKFEKFDKISYHQNLSGIYHNDMPSERGKFNDFTYDGYVNFLCTGDLKMSVDFPQDNPNHTYSVSRHMHEAYLRILKDFPEKDVVLGAALLHDCGKPFCKSFGEDGYAHYYGHDKVSAQIAVELLMEHDLPTKDILHITTLINLHMRMHQEGGRKKLMDLVGHNMYKELMILHNADTRAK